MSATSKDAGAGPARPARRAKKLLAPSVKYEIFLQLVRDETTVNKAGKTFRNTLFVTKTLWLELRLQEPHLMY